MKTAEAKQSALREVREALIAEGVPVTTRDAISRAVSMGEHALDLLVGEMRERAQNPRFWYVYHTGMARDLPHWRVLARARHRAAARRYWNLWQAGGKVACAA